MSGIAVTFYEPGQEAQIEELERMGIEFIPKRIQNGEVIDTYDRKRRATRKDESAGQTFDPHLHGLRMKMKKNIKPGYKKKLQYIAKQKQRKQRKKK